MNYFFCIIHSSIHQNTGDVAVEENSAIFFSAALSEKVQHACSDLWGEGLVEVFRCYEIQQMLSSLAARVEALGDVEGVGDGVLLILQTQALQASYNLSCWAVLGDDVALELLYVRLPQDVPATVSWIE